MKKRLFNQFETYTTEANELFDEIQKAVEPIFKNAAIKYQLRDIELLATIAVDSLISEYIISAAIDKAECDLDSICTICSGEIIEEEYTNIGTTYHCSQCGLVYKFLPPATARI